jgi:hypothetical protein
MLIGAHVSPAGGLWRAVERGSALGAQAIQIFNQSPRMWRPTAYGEEDFARFRAALAESDIGAVMIHAVYLINCASEDPEIRAKSVASLTQSLRVGDAIGAHCVVLHPGSAKGGPVDAAIARAGAVFGEALAESERCPLSDARSASSPRCWSSAAAGSASGFASIHATCSHRAMTSGRPASSRMCSTTATRRSERDAFAPCTSTTRRPRWGPIATATQTSVKASWDSREPARSCASHASMRFPAYWRPRDGTAAARLPRRSRCFAGSPHSVGATRPAP